MKTPLLFCASLTLACSIGLLASTSAIAQSQAPARQDVFVIVDQMPEFAGGEKAMLQYLGQNIRYQKDQPEGLVIATFVVNPDKSVSDIEIMRGIHPELDKECVRVIESMSGQWTPGRQNGKEVPVRFTAPIRFAQDKTTPETNPTTIQQSMPAYKDGELGMLNFISQNLNHNRAKSPEGITTVSFIIHEDGTLSDYKIESSLSPELDAEALRVVKLMSGDWKPGMQQGQPVKIRYTLPVRFTRHKPKPIKEQHSKETKQVSPQTTQQETPRQTQPEKTRELSEREIQALEGDAPFAKVDQMPAYEGGQDELLRFLQEAVPTARKQKGLSIFTFIVNRDGSISDVQVLKSVHAATDSKIAEALKSTSGKWTPGQQFEYKVRVSYTLPVNYPISGAQNTKVVVSPVGG